MKGFDACVSRERADDFLSKPAQSVPIHLVSISYDEEISCEGSLDDDCAASASIFRGPSACIVGEPTLMRVADGQKSVATYLTRMCAATKRIRRKPTQGVSAIEVADKTRSRRSTGIGEAFRTGVRPMVPVGSIRLTRPCMSARSTGGTARNIMAKRLPLPLGISRAARHADPRGLRPVRGRPCANAFATPTFKRDFPDCHIETLIECEVPGLVPAPGSAAEQLALALTGHNATDAVSYATEAGQFQKAGIATVICGPGSIDQAHQRDEFIADSELQGCLRFLCDLATRLS